jgi:phosphate transport system permease protein
LVRCWGALSSWSSREVDFGDRVFRSVAALFALAVILVLAGMVVETTEASADSLARFGLGFLSSSRWDPIRGEFGALPYIFGTVASSLLALLIAVPVAIGVAVFLSELAVGWLRQPIGFLVELLAAIPSVVYGLWGIVVMCPWLRDHVQPRLDSLLGWTPLFEGPPLGYGLLAGGLILAIMILPTIASVSRDVMRAVPDTQREAALALGATRWEVVRVAVLPYARSGIIGAIILGLGRALGETMAVTMVIGNRPEISWSLNAPSDTMASVIANQYSEATSDLHLSALSEIGLVLFGVTLLLNIAARLLVWRVARPAGGAQPV